jgi:Recombination endonuclease VII
MKTCRNKDCSQINPQSFACFSLKTRYKDGFNTWCKSCVNRYNRDRTKNNPEQASEKYKRYYWKDPEKARKKARLGRFKQKYWPELTLKQIDAVWNAMFAEQKGLCSVCEKPKPLEVEHCHVTGKVRSLACNGCNTALGRIYENVSIAHSLIKYIEKHA